MCEGRWQASAVAGHDSGGARSGEGVASGAPTTTSAVSAPRNLANSAGLSLHLRPEACADAGEGLDGHRQPCAARFFICHVPITAPAATTTAGLPAGRQHPPLQRPVGHHRRPVPQQQVRVEGREQPDAGAGVRLLEAREVRPLERHGRQLRLDQAPGVQRGRRLGARPSPRRPGRPTGRSSAGSAAPAPPAPASGSAAGSGRPSHWSGRTNRGRFPTRGPKATAPAWAARCSCEC